MRILVVILFLYFLDVTCIIIDLWCDIHYTRCLAFYAVNFSFVLVGDTLPSMHIVITDLKGCLYQNSFSCWELYRIWFESEGSQQKLRQAHLA